LVSLKPHRPRRSLPQTGVGFFLASILALALTACSDLAPATEGTPTGGADAAAATLVASRLRTVFKDPVSYQAFELSGLRWVHTFKGWSWLACVRFQDHGHQRLYAVFIKDRAVTEDRYAVETDACETQTYVPFDPGIDAMRPASYGIRQPIY